MVKRMSHEACVGPSRRTFYIGKTHIDESKFASRLDETRIRFSQSLFRLGETRFWQAKFASRRGETRIAQYERAFHLDETRGSLGESSFRLDETRFTFYVEGPSLEGGLSRGALGNLGGTFEGDLPWKTTFVGETAWKACVLLWFFVKRDFLKFLQSE